MRRRDLASASCCGPSSMRGEAALARTPELLDVLRDAGVVDAGGAGLVEIVRGIVAAVTGESSASSRAEEEALGLDAIHRELSEFRYCTAFLVEGTASTARRSNERAGSSATRCSSSATSRRCKVHVHTDDPGAALSLRHGAGAICRRRDRRHARPDGGARGAADRRRRRVAPDRTVRRRRRRRGGRQPALCTRASASRAIVEGGQSMNPSTADILEAIESTRPRRSSCCRTTATSS